MVSLAPPLPHSGTSDQTPAGMERDELLDIYYIVEPQTRLLQGPRDELLDIHYIVEPKTRLLQGPRDALLDIHYTTWSVTDKDKSLRNKSI